MWNDIIAYAVATFLTAFAWLVLCQIDLPEYKMVHTEWLYLLLTISAYFITNHFNIWIGMIIYVGWVVVEIFLFFSREIKQLLAMLTKGRS